MTADTETLIRSAHLSFGKFFAVPLQAPLLQAQPPAAMDTNLTLSGTVEPRALHEVVRTGSAKPSLLTDNQSALKKVINEFDSKFHISANFFV